MIKRAIWYLLRKFPPTRGLFETRKNQTPIKFKHLIFQRILGFNREVYWPIHLSSTIGNVKNIYAGVDTSPGYSAGCYIQGGGKTYIGDYTQIAPNVGIISSNHDLYDSRKKIVSDVVIGKYCWIGMNSVILPGVVLGDFTIVGAGSVVTKSYVKGYCVIAGNPAKIIKILEKEKCIPFKNEYEYNGFIKSSLFDTFRKNKLNL